MGVNLALARVGSVLNDVVGCRAFELHRGGFSFAIKLMQVSAAIATNMPVYWAYWVGAIICGL